MPWNEDPKEKSPKDLNEEQKEDSFSFLQETIKPEPITGKQVRKQLCRKLKPMTDPEKINTAQEQTEAPILKKMYECL